MSAARMLPRPSLLELSIAGPIDPWLELGFASDLVNNSIRIGATTLRFDHVNAPAAILAWNLDPSPGDIDGLRTSCGHVALADDDAALPPHSNGATVIDHIVVMSPDIDRTDQCFAAAGFDRRRVRKAGTPERPMSQSFYRLGEVVLEVVGPDPGRGRGPASFWGFVVVVTDLEEMVSRFCHRVGPLRAAVQPGRHIATVEKSAGLGIPMAFMDAEAR